METYPEQVFQNHMVHHPLLQYQMLFPSLLMSLGAPPSSSDGDEDAFADAEGKVNTIDYLRFSALANQLAITQINQVLMDLVMETPGDDIKKLTEYQKTFSELIKKGFSQLSKDNGETRAIVASNNQFSRKQENTLSTLQDLLVKGFVDSIDKMVTLQDTTYEIFNRTTSDGKDFHGKLQSMGDSLRKIQDAVKNITEESLCCNTSSIMEQERLWRGVTPPTEAPLISTEILQTVQGELRNLTKSLGDFISTIEDARSERTALRNLMESCVNASLRETNIDLSNITRMIEKGLANSLEVLQPQIGNITEDLGSVNASLLKTQEDIKANQLSLAANLTKSEIDLEALKKLTLEGFAGLTSKIESLYNVSSSIEKSKDEPACPEEFFAVGEECFLLTTDAQISFDEAKDECMLVDGHLAEPESLIKFIVATDDLNFNKTIGLWMGGHGVPKEKPPGQESPGPREIIWKWIASGDSIDHGWGINHPLNDGTCLILYDQGLQSSACNLLRGFVCERFR